jgi:hypothetical protein
LRSLVLGSTGIAVAREIDDAFSGSELEEIQQPRSPRRLAGPRERAPSDKRVDGAGLAGIRATREGYLDASIRRELRRRGCAQEKPDIRESAHDAKGQGSSAAAE